MRLPVAIAIKMADPSEDLAEPRRIRRRARAVVHGAIVLIVRRSRFDDLHAGQRRLAHHDSLQLWRPPRPPVRRAQYHRHGARRILPMCVDLFALRDARGDR